MTITATAVNFLFLTQEVDTNIKVLAVEHTVGITDAVGQNLIPQSPRSLLHLQQSVRLSGNLTHAAENTLVLSQQLLRSVFVESVTSLLFVWQDAQHPTNWPDVTQSLALTQEAVATVATGILTDTDLGPVHGHVLTLTQEVVLSMSIGLGVESVLELGSKTSGYLPSYYWQSYPVNVVEP